MSYKKYKEIYNIPDRSVPPMEQSQRFQRFPEMGGQMSKNIQSFPATEHLQSSIGPGHLPVTPLSFDGPPPRAQAPAREQYSLIQPLKQCDCASLMKHLAECPDCAANVNSMAVGAGGPAGKSPGVDVELTVTILVISIIILLLVFFLLMRK